MQPARSLGGTLDAAAVLAASLAGCSRGESGVETNAVPAPAPAKPEYGDFGVDLTARKDTVKPGDDFSAYANGSWQDTFTIPADKAAYMGQKLDEEAFNVQPGDTLYLSPEQRVKIWQ